MADTPIRLKPSTQVHSATYDPQAKRLTLELNGATVAAHDFPPEKAVAFGEAESHGKFFHQYQSRNNTISDERTPNQTDRA